MIFVDQTGEGGSESVYMFPHGDIVAPNIVLGEVIDKESFSRFRKVMGVNQLLT